MVLEVLGDQQIPREGEMKRFRAEADFLVRALLDFVFAEQVPDWSLGKRVWRAGECALEKRDLPRGVL